MKTLHIFLFIISVTIISFSSQTVFAFPKNTTDDKSYDSNVITIGPKNLPPEIKDMFTCYDPHMDMRSSSVYKINNQGLKFILDTNQNLTNNISSLNESVILDKFFSTVEKKLVSESPKFQALHGNDTSIIFGKQWGVGGYLSCGEVGIVGAFQTDSGEKYRIIFEMNRDYAYAIILYPDLETPLSYKIPAHYLIITEVEFSSKNGTQWIRIYNPTSYDIPLNFVYVIDDKVSRTFVDFDKNSILKSGHDTIVKIHPSQSSFNSAWANVMNSIIIYPNEQIVPFESVTYDPGPNISSMYWDKTPLLTDTYNDSRTWQYNGTGWMFTDKQVAIPEFPFTFPILLASFVSVIVFYRIRFRK